jgi:hypothetical protein
MTRDPTVDLIGDSLHLMRAALACLARGDRAAYELAASLQRAIERDWRVAMSIRYPRTGTTACP